MSRQFSLRSLFKLQIATAILLGVVLSGFGSAVLLMLLVPLLLISVLAVHSLAVASLMVPIAFKQLGVRSSVEFLFGVDREQEKLGS